MNYYICEPCERKYPNRPKNIFATRKAVRTHLRIEHNLGHVGSGSIIGKNKGRGITDIKCGCLAKQYRVKLIEVI